jgi:hypothetical protein
MKIFFALPVVFFCNTIQAQEEAIDTDRPDQTESVNLVPKKWFQFEAGLNVQENGKNNLEYLTPTLLCKYGISDKIELRLNTSILTTSYLTIPHGTVSNTGLEPVEVGAKIALWQAKKWIPKTSFIFHFGIPGVASKANNIHLIAANFIFTMQNSITQNFGIGYNLGGEWDGEDRVPAYIYSFSPGLNFADDWYGYLEAFGTIKKNTPPQHSIDGGIAYNITNNFKIDLSSGFGITKATPDWYIALGFSKRFK